METYNFMWGGKLSLMLVKAMHTQLWKTIAKDGKEVDTNIPETIFIAEDGVFEIHMPDESIKILEDIGKKYLDAEYTDMMIKKVDKHVKEFFMFCDKIKDIDMSKLSNDELKDIVRKYEHFCRTGLLYFGISSDFTTSATEKKIKEILGKDRSDDFISLTTPTEMDETMKERIDFNELIRKGASEKDLISYSRRYPGLFINSYNKEEIISFLKKKLEAGKSDEDIKKESLSIMRNLDSISEKQNSIFAEYNNPELKRLSKQLQKIGLDRYRLKHVWHGSEYMCLHMLEELARRADISLVDFVKAYSFTEVYDLLDNKPLTPDKIAERKKCIIFHKKDGKITEHTGRSAKEHAERLLSPKKENLSEEVKGTIANKGTAKGRVKIVNVRDLTQFVKDCENFERGEILVTTMTSPIMVPIIEKAAAIVTVEGGICSHAAVISREFNIPCIVGTGNATKALKDGDIVEVDADTGIVKKIKRHDPDFLENRVFEI